jgi:hypothetical protein
MPFWNKVSLLDLENDFKEEAFLSNNHSVLTGKQCGRCCSFGNGGISLNRCMCSQLSETGLFGAKKAKLHLQIPKLQKRIPFKN